MSSPQGWVSRELAAKMMLHARCKLPSTSGNISTDLGITNLWMTALLTVLPTEPHTHLISVSDNTHIFSLDRLLLYNQK